MAARTVGWFPRKERFCATNRQPNYKIWLRNSGRPPEEMAKVVPMYAPPSIGDLVLAEAQDIGRHTRMEIRTGVTMYLFLVITSWVRSATAAPRTSTRVTMPTRPVECDLLSVGGVCGEVASTRLHVGRPYAPAYSRLGR